MQPHDSIESFLISAGRDRQPGSPLNVPLYPASNFILGGTRAYARDEGTPNWDALEEIVGGLEGGEAVSFASGMAAIAAIFEQLPAGATVLIPDDCYQGVAGLASTGQAKGRWSVQKLPVCRHVGLDLRRRHRRSHLARIALESPPRCCRSGYHLRRTPQTGFHPRCG